MNIRVMVVGDDPLSRAGLGVLLAARPELTIVATSAVDDDLPAMVDVYRPDVVLWDLGWDVQGGALRLADFAESLPAPPVVALAPDDAPMRMIWTAGARGIVSRDAAPERMAAALAAAAQGFSVLELAITADLISEARSAEESQSAGGSLLEPLTPRELEVLVLVAEGLPNKTIAQRLGISEHTVKFHVNAILGKLGAESRTEAVVRATRLGLILL